MTDEIFLGPFFFLEIFHTDVSLCIYRTSTTVIRPTSGQAVLFTAYVWPRSPIHLSDW